MLSTCWLLFRHTAVQLIPSQIGLSLGNYGGQVLAQHSITLFIGQIALTQPGGVFWVIVLLKNI